MFADWDCKTWYLDWNLRSFFSFLGAPWDEIVNALLSNTEERSKTVTLVFERELPDDDEEEEEEVAPPATA